MRLREVYNWYEVSLRRITLILFACSRTLRISMPYLYVCITLYLRAKVDDLMNGPMVIKVNLCIHFKLNQLVDIYRLS